MGTSRQQPWLHREGNINGVRLHWVEAGQKGSPLVLLLHGFPEFWYSWRHQIPFLSREGFRVVAPDLRGYNLSDKPKCGYDIETLTTDVLGLITYLGETSAGIVGHDCGAAIAWAFAARFPLHTTRLIILNAPPIQKLMSSLDGWHISWYVFLLWLPSITEYLGGCNRAWVLSYSMKYFAKETNWLDEETIELYRGSISRPGALHCMMEYYRNMRSSAKQCEQYGRVQAPTLVLWGEHDTVFQTALCQGLEDFVLEKLSLEILDSGHWIQQEVPEEVNRRLIRFLR